MAREVPLRAYFGHHKAASDWIHNIVEAACRELGLNYVYLHHPRQFDSDLRAFVGREGIDFFTFANAKVEYVRGLEGLRGFHVVRDPRDIAVSAYFSHLHSHSADDFPRLAAHRDRLRKVPEKEGLTLELEFSTPVFEDMRTWDYSQPNVLELKMEQMIREPGEYFGRVFTFLGLLDGSGDGPGPRITKDRLLGIVEQFSFTRQAGGRKPGQEDVKSHYRKGVPGDWKNHFAQEHEKFFKRNYNELLLKLGYETDPDWRGTGERPGAAGPAARRPPAAVASRPAEVDP